MLCQGLPLPWGARGGEAAASLGYTTSRQQTRATCSSSALLQMHIFSGGRHEKERGLLKVRSQSTGRRGGPQIPPWRTHRLLYHFSQAVGTIPDVGLLEVDLPEPAGMMGGRSHPYPSQGQRACEEKRETATAAEEYPSWETDGQGPQGGHGSRSKVVCPSRLQLQHSALMRESGVSVRQSGQGKVGEAQRLQALPLLWFSMCSAGGKVHLI